jgi:hypothetical protein
MDFDGKELGNINQNTIGYYRPSKTMTMLSFPQLILRLLDSES